MHPMLVAAAESGDTLQFQAWSVVAGSVLPLLVAVVTKVATSAQVKAWLLLGLSAVTSVSAEAVDAGGDFAWKTAATTFAMTFGMGVLAHFGVFKAGIAPWLQRNVGRT
jgi:hypothetical protein